MTAKAAGSATVTAMFQGMTAIAKVDVSAPEVDTLTIAPTNSSIAQNRTQDYVVTAGLSDGTSQDVSKLAVFTTDDTQGIVSLSGNVATGTKQGGPVTITASYMGKQASAKLTVTAPVTVVSLSVSPGYSSVPVGGQVPLKATALYSDNSTEDVTDKAVFTSADRTTVDLNANVAIGLAVGGPVTITVTYGGQSATAAVKVTSAALVSIEVQAKYTLLPRPATTATGRPKT